jgi:orotidine-5'-phosphate decarboxylase
MMPPRIFVALDYPEAGPACELVARLDPTACGLKVGKELFTAAGPQLVREFVAAGFPVFLDLKFHDIPNTVAAACRAAADLGVWMLNVHAGGGPAMLAAARTAVNGAQAPRLIAVTVLTSMDTAQLAAVGIADAPAAQVARLAALSARAGLDGVVCSAQEAGALKIAHGPDFLTVTPGIRPAGSQADDQSRTLTPAEAMAAGADYLVIGRPITQASDPQAALYEIRAQMGVASR